MIPYLYIPIVILLGCFLFGNNISAEAGKKKRGIHLYFTQPIRRSSLFTAKYLSGLLYTVGYVVLMLLIPLLCSLFTKGLGNFNYPVLVYESGVPNPYGAEFNALNPIQDQFHFISLIEYLRHTIVLTIVLVIFLYSLYYVFSLIIKSPTITVIFLSIITYCGMRVYSSRFNPFTYIDIHKVLTGESAAMNFNHAINFQNGILSLFTISIVIVFLGYGLFIKFVKIN